MKFWTYIERNHERFGVALFIIPAMLLPTLLIGLCVVISKL